MLGLVGDPQLGGRGAVANDQSHVQGETLASVRPPPARQSVLCISRRRARRVAAPAAQADLVSLDHCDNAALSQPFAPWLDTNAYKLAPGGDFEGAGTAWTLHNGASLTGRQ